MPIYEFQCETCGQLFERLMRRDEDFPPCPSCGSDKVIKVPSLFGFQDKSAYNAERERAILKRTRDYLMDGKIRDAQRFLEKAKEFHPSDKIKRISERLSEKKPPKGGFLVKPEVAIVKKKG
ncbi:MAG: FmdB family zinc ribbon protein [Caldimicrobium sp.]